MLGAVGLCAGCGWSALEESPPDASGAGGAAELAVTVVDAGGAPLEGIRALLSAEDGSGFSIARTSDAWGRASFAPPTDTPLRLSLDRAAEGAQAAHIAPLVAGERRDLGRLAVAPSCSLGGAVLDPAQRPVPGALVVLRRIDSSLATLGPLSDGADGADGTDEADGADERERVEHASCAGRFRFRGLRAGIYWLSSRGPHGSISPPELVEVDGAGRDVVVHARRIRTVTGRVSGLDRTELEGARVLVVSGAADLELPAAEALVMERGLATDRAGRFELGLSGPSASLLALAPGRALARRDHLVAGDHVDLALPPAATVEARVVDGAGRPLPGATVRVRPCAPLAPDVLLDELGATDREGALVLRRLPHGAYRLDTRSGGLRGAAEIEVREASVAVRLTAAPTRARIDPGDPRDPASGPGGRRRLQVRVLDAWGEPVASYPLRLARTRAPSFAAPAETDPWGFATWLELTPGEYVVSLAPRADAPPSAHSTSLAADVSRSDARLQLRVLREPQLRARVTRRGTPLVDADVALVSCEEPQRLAWTLLGVETMRRTDVRGRATLVGSRPGRHYVCARATPHSPATVRTLELSAGRNVLDIELARTALRGSVETAAGEPLPGARVWLIPERGAAASSVALTRASDVSGERVTSTIVSGQALAVTARDGTFELCGAEPGRYDLRIDLEGHFSRTASIEIDERSASVVDVGPTALDARCGVRGTVVAPAGSPVQGGIVRLWTAGGRPRGARRLGPDGRFDFGELVPGDYELSVRGRGFADEGVRLDLRSGLVECDLALATDAGSAAPRSARLGVGDSEPDH